MEQKERSERVEEERDPGNPIAALIWQFFVEFVFPKPEGKELVN